MKKVALPRVLTLLPLALVVSVPACGDDGPGITSEGPNFPLTLIEQTVNVPAGADQYAFLALSGTPGWRIRITLTAANTARRPYAFLDAQSGSTLSAPPVETAADGINTIELILPPNAPYSMSIMLDPSEGGAVTVKVERLS